MKTVKLLAVTLFMASVAWSCQSGPSETDMAYEEVVQHTDSIMKMNQHLRDTLQMVKQNNEKLLVAVQDTTADDSTRMATLSRNKIILDEKKASLDKINAQADDFKKFESQHNQGDMNEKDVEAQVDEIKRQQNDLFSTQKQISRDLNQMHRDQQKMMERNSEKPETDGQKIDNNKATEKNKSAQK